MSRSLPDFTHPQKAIGKPLADAFLSRKPFILKPLQRAVVIQRGASPTEITVDGVALESTLEVSYQQLKQGVAIALADRLVLLLHLAIPVSVPHGPDHDMVGYSDALQFVRDEINRVADLKVPVLLRGRSGSGKELAAKAIHQIGCPDQPFVSVNMGAIPASLAASALFGALKGSYTGADRHQMGYFRAAQGGTLFLDEVAEAPLEIQVMLLRVLEAGEMTPVGSQTPVKVDVRLIAATDADLVTMIRKDSFKAPLFHRLAGYQIALPKLGERLDDFGRLFLHFAREELEKMGSTHFLTPVDPKADSWVPAHLMCRLLQFPWPGNVRQLRNLVRQLVIGCRGETVLKMTPRVEELLRESAQESKHQNGNSKVEEPSGTSRVSTPEKQKDLVETLRANRWEIKATAAQLGISRSTLYEWMDRMPGIRRASTLSREEIVACLAANESQIDAAAESLQVSSRALRRRITALRIS